MATCGCNCSPGMSGSTLLRHPAGGLALVVLALLMLAACLLVSRWLDLMPMGLAAATALGIHLGRAQLTISLVGRSPPVPP